MNNIKNSFLILFYISFYLFASQNVLNWDSMTSLINPTSIIQHSNNDIVAATSGGLLVLNENNLEILKDNLNNLDLSILGLDKKGLIWIGGTSPNGNIQVLDSNYNLIYDSSYLEIESVLDFCFSDNRVFVVYSNLNDIGILEFNYDNDIPYYIDYYNSFPNQINSISDLDLFDDYIYVTTNQGIFRSNFIENNLKISSSWIQPSYGIDNSEILFFYRNDDASYLVTEQNLYLNQDNFSSSILEFDSVPFDIFSNNQNIVFCNKTDCYEINDSMVNLLYSIDLYEINWLNG